MFTIYDYFSESAKVICGKAWSAEMPCAMEPCTNTTELLVVHGNYSVIPYCKNCFNKNYFFQLVPKLSNQPFSFGVGPKVES